MSEAALNKMRNRFKYDWRLSDFLFTFVAPCSFICDCSKNKKFGFKQRLGLFEKGETKYIKEFDAVYYAQNIRNLKTLVTSMMDDSERFLVAYQRYHSISAFSDTASSHEDEDYDDVPNLYAGKEKKDKHLLKVDEFMVISLVFELNRESI
jgi:hypothetical protein